MTILSIWEYGMAHIYYFVGILLVNLNLKI